MAEEIIIEKKSPQALKIVLAIVISAVIFGLLGYYLGKNKSVSEPTTPAAETAVIEQSVVTTASPVNSVEANRTSASFIYTDKDFGFSFKVPTNYSVQKTQLYEGARGATISFGKIESDRIAESNYASLKYIVDDSSLSTLDNNYKGEFSADLSDRKEFKLDGNDAISYLVGGLASGKTILSTNGKAALEISVYPDNNDSRAFIDSVASSFKF